MVCPRPRVFLLTIASAVSLVFSCHSYGQMMTVGDDTSTPLEGAGHNYIKALSESVSPANGSVSLRIEMPIPKGRGIMLPFSVEYDTNGIVSLSAPAAFPGWYSPGSQGGDFLSSGGWSYDFPLLTSREWTQTLHSGSPTVTCNFRAGYIFHDPLGGRHSLYLGTPGYQSGSNGQVSCGSPLTGSVDPQFSGHFTVSPPTRTGSLLNPVKVSDNNGTTYYFPGFVSQELPARIEDRNGNLITFSSANTNSNPITVTDTLGRTVISSSGFGSGTTTISTPGQQYSVVWGTNSASYTIPVTMVKNTVPPGDTNHGCQPVGTSVKVSGNVISSISLPNGQQYKFYYGTNPNPSYNNSYGLLSEIDYPTGAWVRYTWKLSDNPNEPAIYDAACNAGSTNCTPLHNACQAEYRSPVVATRTVGFGGTATAEVQNFTYNTAWNTSLNPIAWSSKSTSVMTTDQVRALSGLTKYTYGSVPGTGSPYVEYTVAQQIPVESSIQYYDWSNTSSPVRTVNKSWLDQYRMKSEQLVLNDASNLSSQTVYSYAGF